jgi:hypothetical protein
MSKLDLKPGSVNFSPAVSVVGNIRPGSPKETLFEFAKDGEPARVLPVDDRNGTIIDFVAYTDENPLEWFTRRGEGVLLGARQLAGCENTGGPLRLFHCPEAWLQGHGWGVCILDWSVRLLPLFENIELDLGHLDPHVADIMERRLETNFRRGFPTITRKKGASHAA